MSFCSQSTIPDTPLPSTPGDDDAASEVASSALSTSYSTAPPTTVLRAQAQPASHFQPNIHVVEGIPNDAGRQLVQGREYVLEEDLARRRQRTSWVWRHGIGLVDTASGIRFWKCNECSGPLLLRSHSTDHLARHLERKHRLGPNGRIAANNPFSRASASVSAVDTTATALITRVTVDTFRKRLLAWMIAKRVTFTQVESPEFRDLVTYLHPGLGGLLPASRKSLYDVLIYLTNYSTDHTIHAWILSEFDRCKVLVKRLLAATPGQIHLSFDLWTSPNSYALLGLVAHFFDGKDSVLSLPLGIPRLHGPHSGANIAEKCEELIWDYGIADKIGIYIYLYDMNVSN